MKNRLAAIRHELGGVFADEENTYASFGKDWWSIKYAPRYPEETPGDLIAYGCPLRHDFQLLAPALGLGGVAKRFHTFSDLCECTKGA